MSMGIYRNQPSERIACAALNRTSPVTRLTKGDESSTGPVYRPYATLLKLRESLLGLPMQSDMTVVIVLDENFCGHLPSLIRRPRTANRALLVLVAPTGRLPKSDLESLEGWLGWNDIILERDADRAIEAARSSMGPGERLIVFTPEWRTAK